MRFHLTWEGRTRTVASAGDVDTALEEVAALVDARGLPVVVTVMPPDAEDLPYFDEDAPDFLQAGIGHPDLAFVTWTGHPGGHGYEPDRPPGPPGVRFLYEGQPVYPEPAELRVAPETARRAVREYVTTGGRPACLRWLGDAEGDGPPGRAGERA